MIEDLSVLLSAALVVASISLFEFAVLAFRNPYRPAWLKTSSAEIWATIGLVGLFALAVCYQIQSLIAAGVPTSFAIVGVPMFVIGVAVTIWRWFRCGDRLSRADSGQSPFDRDQLPWLAPPKLDGR